MTINWVALVQVAVVTLVAATLVVTLLAVATRLLRPLTAAGTPTTAGPLARTSGYALMVAMAGIVGFGLYLIIPYFH